MNEDKKKMIEEIKAIIDDRCEAELGQVHASSKGGKVTKTVDTSLIAKDIYNAGYRKVADDEIVIKKRKYEQLKKYNRDRKRLRLKWQQAKQDLDDIYSNGFVLLVEHHEIVDKVARETRQETAREIINMLTPPCKACDANWHKGCMCLQKKIIKQIAQKYDIELED